MRCEPGWPSRGASGACEPPRRRSSARQFLHFSLAIRDLKHTLPQGTFTPFTYTFSDRPRARSSSDPSTAVARLQVIGCGCRLAGSLSAPVLHSDRPELDHLDRSAHVCRLTDDGVLFLHEATEANLGFRYVCQQPTQQSWTCPTHVCMRPEAPSHASAKPFRSCVLPVTVCARRCS